MTLREQIAKAKNIGDWQAAISGQQQLIEQIESEGNDAIPAQLKLANLYFNNNDLATGLKLSEHLVSQTPNDPVANELHGVMLGRLNRPKEALPFLEKANQLKPDQSNVLDALAHISFAAGQRQKAKKYGEASLELKDKLVRQQASVFPIPDQPPPSFTFDEPEKHIISFSLWGNHPRYILSALENARIAQHIYPGWRCRFYCGENVKPATIDELQFYGAEIVSRPMPTNHYEGLFWRFFPVFDKQLKRVLIRDCDAVINVKERVAVDAWLASDKYFHVMRDYPSHSELILAGMWGAVAGVLPSLDQLLAEFTIASSTEINIDQLFLRQRVWPTLVQSALIHDSYYQTLGAQPFPDAGALPPDRSIGDCCWKKLKHYRAESAE